MQDVVQRVAQIHQRQRLPLDLVKQIGRIVERLSHAICPEYRETVARTHHLGALARHLPQTRRPFTRPALRLLRIAGIRHRPDEQIPGEQPLLLRHPGPGRVLGLSSRVRHLERKLPNRKPDRIVERNVWIPKLIWPRQPHVFRIHPRTNELPRVDRRVVPHRPLVAIEVSGNMPLPIYDRSRLPLPRRLVVEPVHAKYVIDMVMREHRRPQRRLRTPAAHAVEQTLRVACRPRIQHHQAVARVDRVHRRRRLDVQEPVLDLLRLAVVPGRCHRMRLMDRVDLAAPQTVTEISDIGHRTAPLILAPH